MVPESHLRQEDLLYDLEWVEATDKLFIDVLVDQAAIGNLWLVISVNCDPQTNRITVPNFVWDYIFQRNNFGYAYQQYEDPSWETLQKLFGGAPVVHDLIEKDIINISSDAEHMEGKNEAENEVVLPLMNISSTTESSTNLTFKTYLVGYISDSASDSFFNQYSWSTNPRATNEIRLSFEHLPKSPESFSPSISASSAYPSSSTSNSSAKF
ncbi:hypothetical protein Pfo_018433 [Paulownia fortunei]|nr:hypothetical protein Pfo_018433 [Paulownia fortunei]